MRYRFPPLVLAAALCAGLALGAQAQAPNVHPPADEAPAPVEPPKDLPAPQRGDPTKNLDRLFAALRAAPTNESAKYIEGRIWALWVAAGGDTATLLMSRAKIALDGKDYDLAIKLLTAVIDIKPDYVEAWNRRATINYLRKDFGASLMDLSNVLSREPRHFAAWAGLGMIMQDIGEDKLALYAFRRALDLHPRLDRIPDLVKKLTETVEGRDI